MHGHNFSHINTSKTGLNFGSIFFSHSSSGTYTPVNSTYPNIKIALHNVSKHINNNSIYYYSPQMVINRAFLDKGKNRNVDMTTVGSIRSSPIVEL